MAKPITCISRDARQYCSDWTEKNAMNTSSWQANDECRKYICTKLLEASNVWDISESEPLFFSEKYRYADWGNYLSDGFWLFKNRIFVEDDDLDFTLEEKNC